VAMITDGLDAAMKQARELDAMAVRLSSEAALLRQQASLLRERALRAAVFIVDAGEGLGGEINRVMAAHGEQLYEP